MIKPRASIAKLPPYRSPITTRTNLNLDLNENTSGCSLAVLEKLRSLTIEDVSRYPDRRPGERIVADWLGLDSAQVLLTNGIDEALQLIFWTYLDEHSELLIAEPTFPLYAQYALGAGRRVRSVRYDESFRFPVREFRSAICEATRVLVIANPNNPTGSVIAEQELLSLLQEVPDKLVMIDEAYFEFYGQTLVKRISEHPNLVVTRTFSKAYGLAGLRLGVVAGNVEVIDPLRRLCSPFNVNAIALNCLPDALSDRDFVQRYVKQIVEGRGKMADLCARLGLMTWPSQGNFILAKLGPRCKEFVQSMQKNGIQVSDRSKDINCEGCVRVTISGAPEISKLMQAFENCYKALSD
jgi:histidinol-phosphate aminotransferase